MSCKTLSWRIGSIHSMNISTWWFDSWRFFFFFFGLPFFLTKSPLPICYPRGQLFTQHQSLSPGGQRKKSISPRGDNIGKSAVCHPVPLRLVYATSNATGAWDIHSSRPTVSCQRGLLLLLTIAATRRRRVQTSPRVVRLVFPTCFS